MKSKFTLLRMLILAGILTATASGPRILFAQDEVLQPGDEIGGDCAFKTRWKDAHGKCPSCCDARDYSCPCTI